MTRFPSELRRWRSVRRLSRLELAVRAGTTQRHVSFIEQGRSRPGRSVVWGWRLLQHDAALSA